MCFDGAVGAVRGFGEGVGIGASLLLVFLIVDNVAHCRQNRRCCYVVDFVAPAV